ncbi:MAG: carbohydrate binding family 9 domain-containing protein, partial [Ignavibacteriales bacterium]|nr:carbohydrate binding family 9 domain-containing protein [Ignavibacteriales bacterium]
VMPESTLAYMAYDSKNIYFAFRCFDPDPATIKAEITARDNIRPHDWICINLDSFNDQQSLYAFYVNPLGIQSDSRYAAGNEDFSVDFVWYSAGQMDEQGYTIEMGIPLKSIRYADDNPVEMSVFFERKVSRRQEHGSFPSLDPKRGYAFLTQMLPMVYPDLDHYTLFELLPAVTYSEQHRSTSGDLALEKRLSELSVTTKYGITSNLILDGTYNPDFNQVEADAGQIDINLRSPLFFAEKRPFFLEGSEIFNVSAASDWVPYPVYTRSVVDPVVGLKLSGKIGSQSTLASIYAIDDIPVEDPARKGMQAHFPILRYKHSLSEDSYIGGLYAGRELSESYNRLAGADGSLRVSSSSTLGFNILSSQTKLADTASQLTGYTFSGAYGYGTRDLDYRFEVSKISQDFASEAGYVARTGGMSFGAYLSPKFYPEMAFLRRFDLQLSSSQTRDDFSGLWETLNQFSVVGIFPSGVNLALRYSYSTEVFLGQRFKTGGFTVSGGGQFNGQINFTASYRTTEAIFFSATPYQGTSNRATAALTYQPWNQVEMNVNFMYSSFFRTSDNLKIYEYPISRIKLTYQLNQYVFFRGISEANNFRKQLLTDFLASFTYIPGTVAYLGYGSLYEKLKWENNSYVADNQYLETRRGFFFKLSYLWRV